MAFFGVTKEKIKTARTHPNADRLDICELEGMSFQFVTGRDNYKVGDEVLYFPLDSLFPFWLMEKMGLVREQKKNGEVVLDENGNPVLEGCLSGKKKNRVKTLRLRDELSQGIVGSLTLLEGYEGDGSPESMTEFFEITKYEPEDIPCKNGNLVSLPAELSVYDIEGADRFAEVTERLMDIPVCITEKIEGTNFSVTYRPKTDEFFVNQRNHSIIPKKDGHGAHMFWALVEKIKLREFLTDFYKNCESVTYYGEFIGPGIQKNIYGLKGHTVKFFDVKVDGRFISVVSKGIAIENFNKFYNDLFEESPMMDFAVPCLFSGKPLREYLEGDTIQNKSNGKSVLNENVLREGIVITPMIEERDMKIGRLIIKQRSPEYLSNEK